MGGVAWRCTAGCRLTRKLRHHVLINRFLSPTTMPSRPGQLNLAAILSAQAPTIDLHFPAYEASTRNFSQAIADFNSRAIAEINQRREAHTTEMKRLAERAQNMEKETNQCKMKEIELIGGSCGAARRAISHFRSFC